MKLKKQFEEFIQAITIDKESIQLQDKRKILEGEIRDNLPTKMADHDIELKKTEIEIFDQGSYKYHTTIKGTPFDRDVAVMIPLDKDEHTDPRKIKGYLRDAISSVNNRTVKIKEPCVTVSYTKNDEEWMHIDLPLYVVCDGEVYLARGKEFSSTYEWEEADPKGLNEDLCSKINGNDQLRRIIRYIKKWKSVKYDNSTLDHEIPPSIGLTYLACDCFVSVTDAEGRDNDLESLYQTMKNIKNRFIVTRTDGEITKADISYKLPVKPYTDIFKTMKESSDQYGITFYNRITKAVDALADAINVESEHEAGKCVQKVLGEEFKVPPKDAKHVDTSNKKEKNFG